MPPTGLRHTWRRPRAGGCVGRVFAWLKRVLFDETPGERQGPKQACDSIGCGEGGQGHEGDAQGVGQTAHVVEVIGHLDDGEVAQVDAEHHGGHA